MTDKQLRFFLYALQRLEKAGHSVHLYLADSDEAKAEYDEYNKALYAKLYEFDTFIHEYAHFIQSERKTDAWVNCGKSYDKVMDFWIDPNARKPSLKDIKKVIRLERETENIAMAQILNFDLDIDRHEYYRSANAYLYSFYFLRELGFWPNCIYRDREVLDIMPDNCFLALKHYLSPEENLKKVVDKNYKV